MSPVVSWMLRYHRQPKHHRVVEPTAHLGARNRMRVMRMWASLQGLRLKALLELCSSIQCFPRASSWAGICTWGNLTFFSRSMKEFVLILSWLFICGNWGFKSNSPKVTVAKWQIWPLKTCLPACAKSLWPSFPAWLCRGGKIYDSPVLVRQSDLIIEKAYSRTFGIKTLSGWTAVSLPYSPTPILHLFPPSFSLSSFFYSQVLSFLMFSKQGITKYITLYLQIWFHQNYKNNY